MIRGNNSKKFLILLVLGFILVFLVKSGIIRATILPETIVRHSFEEYQAGSMD